MITEKFPRIQVKGSPMQRGISYGEQTREKIHGSLSIYREMFTYYTNWNWDQVTHYANQFDNVIKNYRPHFIEEMQGIAQGAGVNYADILALNVRTEIRNAAIARMASGECTAFVGLPDTNTLNHTLIGQNWDWGIKMLDTVVLLEVEPEKGPKFITIVEAGMLAKTGMNSVGLGLVTNALHADIETGAPGVPYHLILRAILESQTLSDAIHAVTYQPRGSSANYLVAHREGEAFNAEAGPGDYTNVNIKFVDEIYAHTNHYIHPHPRFNDLGPWHGPDSLVRYQRMLRFLQEHHGSLSIVGLQGNFADHFNFPGSICSHPELHLPEPEHFATIFSVIMDLDTSTIWLAEGNPCQNPFQEIKYQTFLQQMDN